MRSGVGVALRPFTDGLQEDGSVRRACAFLSRPDSRFLGVIRFGAADHRDPKSRGQKSSRRAGASRRPKHGVWACCLQGRRARGESRKEDPEEYRKHHSKKSRIHE